MSGLCLLIRVRLPLPNSQYRFLVLLWGGTSAFIKVPLNPKILGSSPMPAGFTLVLLLNFLGRGP